MLNFRGQKRLCLWSDFWLLFLCFFLFAVFYCWSLFPNLKADASKIRKLFTACTGPVGAVPREAWKRMDPTWRIVDERNAIGIVVRTQGPFREIFFDFQRSAAIQEL